MKALLKDGAPNTLRTDNGSEFISKEFQAVLKEKGIKHIFSRPHSPQENGMIERFNKTLKGLVYKYLTEWDLEKITNASHYKASAQSCTHRRSCGSQNRAEGNQSSCCRPTQVNFPALRVGDSVRVARRTSGDWLKSRALKKRAYLKNWFYELFKV
eukprot:TRINITY_DN1706_c0_g1_i2.p1 TRINITY_DN1706_c0_g1~~TRINITY_DN1706_c0_g1_i2.p1  ORF type:complete len:165 (+),score=21.51 TRINITY_DN1706_c0_g1_i2:28-495(+)